jgi:hypothetical protein
MKEVLGNFQRVATEYSVGVLFASARIDPLAIGASEALKIGISTRWPW